MSIGWTSGHAAASTARFENADESAPESAVEAGVDERVDGTIAIAEPGEKFPHFVANLASRGAKRRHDVDDEKRSP